MGLGSGRPVMWPKVLGCRFKWRKKNSLQKIKLISQLKLLLNFLNGSFN